MAEGIGGVDESDSSSSRRSSRSKSKFESADGNRKHTSLLIFGLGGYLKASPVGEVLDNESTYVVVGIAFDPHVAAVFTSQMTEMTEMHGQGPSMTKANKNAK